MRSSSISTGEIRNHQILQGRLQEIEPSRTVAIHGRDQEDKRVACQAARARCRGPSAMAERSQNQAHNGCAGHLRDDVELCGARRARHVRIFRRRGRRRGHTLATNRRSSNPESAKCLVGPFTVLNIKGETHRLTATIDLRIPNRARRSSHATSDGQKGTARSFPIYQSIPKATFVCAAITDLSVLDPLSLVDTPSARHTIRGGIPQWRMHRRCVAVDNRDQLRAEANTELRQHVRDVVLDGSRAKT